MSEKEMKSWRTLVNYLYEYAGGNLFKDEINNVANALKRLEKRRLTNGN